MHKHPRQLRPEEEPFAADSKAAFLNKTTWLANSILYVVIALFVLGMIWAYFAKIDQSTNGQGVVISSSYEKVIQSLDGGIVKKIVVHEGETVQKNQPLLLLDDTRYAAQYQEGHTKYLSLLALVARLSAESQDQDVIHFPEELTEKPELTERETHLFQIRRDAYHNEVGALQNSYDLGLKQIAILQPLVKAGVVSQLEFLRTEQATSDAKSKLLEMRDRYHEQVMTDLNQHKGELAAAKQANLVLEDKMVDTTLTSPVHGIVKKIYISTVGGVIQSGSNIMEIVPLEDALLVQVHISPADIAFVHVGQPAVVKVMAYDYSIYGSLAGTVEYISPDIVQEEKPALQAKEPAGYYLVNVRINQNYIAYKGLHLPIIPGMTTSVQIKTGSRTVMEYILKPIMKAKMDALHER
jgi:adhesin transport system membrane fusion protein